MPEARDVCPGGARHDDPPGRSGYVSVTFAVPWLYQVQNGTKKSHYYY